MAISKITVNGVTNLDIASTTTLSVFVSDSGTYGLAPGVTYAYRIIYSE